MSINEFPFEIELFNKEFEQEKIAFVKEITHLKEKKSQLEMDLYLQDGEKNRVIKEKNHFKENL